MFFRFVHLFLLFFVLIFDFCSVWFANFSSILHHSNGKASIFILGSNDVVIVGPHALCGAVLYFAYDLIQIVEILRSILYLVLFSRVVKLIYEIKFSYKTLAKMLREVWNYLCVFLGEALFVCTVFQHFMLIKCRCYGRTVCKVQINWENRVKILIFVDFFSQYYTNIYFVLATATSVHSRRHRRRFLRHRFHFQMVFCIVGSLVSLLAKKLKSFGWTQEIDQKLVLFKIQFSEIRTMSNKKQCDHCIFERDVEEIQLIFFPSFV